MVNQKCSAPSSVTRLCSAHPSTDLSTVSSSLSLLRARSLCATEKIEKKKRGPTKRGTSKDEAAGKRKNRQYRNTNDRETQASTRRPRCSSASSREHARNQALRSPCPRDLCRTITKRGHYCGYTRRFLYPGKATALEDPGRPS